MDPAPSFRTNSGGSLARTDEILWHTCSMTGLAPVLIVTGVSSVTIMAPRRSILNREVGSVPLGVSPDHASVDAAPDVIRPRHAVRWDCGVTVIYYSAQVINVTTFWPSSR